MCLDTAETVAIPEPCFPPAGGHRYARLSSGVHVCFTVGGCALVCDQAQELNKLAGPRSTICLRCLIMQKPVVRCALVITMCGKLPVETPARSLC